MKRQRNGLVDDIHEPAPTILVEEGMYRYGSITTSFLVIVVMTGRPAFTFVLLHAAIFVVRLRTGFVLVLREHVRADVAGVSRLPPQWKFAATLVLPVPL